jgi:hypothetical protein
MRHLANTTDPENPLLGLRKVVGLMDTGRSLAELGLLDETMAWLNQERPGPLNRLADITQVRTVRKLEQQP